MAIKKSSEATRFRLSLELLSFVMNGRLWYLLHTPKWNAGVFPLPICFFREGFAPVIMRIQRMVFLTVLTLTRLEKKIPFFGYFRYLPFTNDDPELFDQKRWVYWPERICHDPFD